MHVLVTSRPHTSHALWLDLQERTRWCEASRVVHVQVCASVAAAASEEQAMPNGALMNGNVSHEHDISTEAVIRALKPFLDPTTDAEVPAAVEEAALDAVGRLGLNPVAASLFFVDTVELHKDVAALALGRAGTHAPARLPARRI